jgi:mono/diheme cytochrome c family protein
MRSAFASMLCALLCCGAMACSAKPPGRLETRTVYWIKRNVTVGGKSQRNPVPATAANIDAGKHAFGYYCVACHGRDGQNTGVPFAGSMAPPIPSMASAEVQAYSDGQLKWIIEHGLFPSGMPASKGLLSDQEMWQVVRYLRALPRAGSLGTPRAYSGDEYGAVAPTNNGSAQN